MSARNRGFTLIELLVVVLVIAILAALALPSYSEYVRKGKRTEAAATIGDIQLRQERWRADNPLYGTMANLFGSAAGATAFNSSLNYYNISITPATPTGTSYTITATRKGDLANDPKCGNFTVSMAAGVLTKGVSSGDVKYCWRQ